MGGECNYLLRVSRDSAKRLEFVPDEQWKSRAMMAWSEEAIQGMLSSAESVLRETAHRLRLPVMVRGCLWSLPKTTAQLHTASAVIRHFNTWTTPNVYGTGISIWSMEREGVSGVSPCMRAWRHFLDPPSSARCLFHTSSCLTGQAWDLGNVWIRIQGAVRLHLRGKSVAADCEEGEGGGRHATGAHGL